MRKRMSGAGFLALLVAAAGCLGCPDTTLTVVYLVRHAEVDYSGGDNNPPLTPAGEQRAADLRDQFQEVALAAVYQTEKVRTRQTAAPVAADQGLEPVEIPDGDNQELVDHVLGEHSGGAVLIVNHSHNLLDILERFGAEPPFAEYPPEYDKLFFLVHTQRKGGDDSAGVLVTEYGAPSP